jgi:glucose-1-phosphate cytidylyltransferase
MVEIGGMPILWHIMKIYSAYGLNDFVICLGYRGYMIKEYFANYYLHTCDVTFDVAKGAMEVHQSSAEPWRVTLVDTGADTQTGGRLKRVLPYIGDEEFCLTYGDGLANVDVSRLLEFHREQGRLATVTAVLPGGRFGALDVEGTRVTGFREKPAGDESWINGGFFVLPPTIGDYIDGDATVFEQEPLRRLVEAGQLSAYEHDGFWQPMDTMREKTQLEELWRTGAAPWKVWS